MRNASYGCLCLNQIRTYEYNSAEIRGQEMYFLARILPPPFALFTTAAAKRHGESTAKINPFPTAGTALDSRAWTTRCCFPSDAQARAEEAWRGGFCRDPGWPAPRLRVASAWRVRTRRRAVALAKAEGAVRRDDGRWGRGVVDSRG